MEKYIILIVNARALRTIGATKYVKMIAIEYISNIIQKVKLLWKKQIRHLCFIDGRRGFGAALFVVGNSNAGTCGDILAFAEPGGASAATLGPPLIDGSVGFVGTNFILFFRVASSPSTFKSSGAVSCCCATSSRATSNRVAGAVLFVLFFSSSPKPSFTSSFDTLEESLRATYTFELDVCLDRCHRHTPIAPTTTTTTAVTAPTKDDDDASRVGEKVAISDVVGAGEGAIDFVGWSVAVDLLVGDHVVGLIDGVLVGSFV